MRLEDFVGIHEEEPVLLLGNGPSLNLLDAGRVKMTTIGIHRSWFVLHSKYHIILRSIPRYPSWRNHWEDYKSLEQKPEVVFTSDPRDPGVACQNLIVVPMEKNSFNAGLLALRIALLMKFNPIYLIGYDMNYNEGNFMDSSLIPPDKSKDRQVKLIAEICDGLTGVYNCSPSSRLTFLPRADIGFCYQRKA